MSLTVRRQPRADDSYLVWIFRVGYKNKPMLA